MNTARSTNRFPAAAGNKRPMCADCSLGFDALMIRIIRGDIGNSGPPLKCGNFSTGKLSSRTGNALSAMKSSQTITMWFPTTGIRKEWAELGEMITRTTSKQRTGGVTEKKDRPEWTDLRPIRRLLGGPPENQLPSNMRCANNVPDCEPRGSRSWPGPYCWDRE